MLSPTARSCASSPGRPEQTAGTNPTGLTVDEYGGNYIVQDIVGGHYAFYAHLQTDNPTPLEIGQRLTRGETIAPLGNTGNSDSPHLHFHVMDSDDPLSSDGLPFVFDAFDYVGQVATGPSFDAASSRARRSRSTPQAPDASRRARCPTT